MAYKEEQTGTRDVTYDLVSILYHALQGADIYRKFTEDAALAKNTELGTFFREIQEEEQQRANRARDLLRKQLEQEETETR